MPSATSGGGWRVYLAGPDVFLPDPVAAFRAKIAICSEFGFRPCLPDPALLARAPEESPQQRAAALYAEAIRLMRLADVGVFHLTPFRGASADPGTVFELGFMAGLGKPTFGYTNVAGDYLERVAPRRQAGEGWVDADGCAIEDFGNADNLMLDMALAPGGGLVRHAAAPSDRLSDLAGFRLCLWQARRRLGGEAA